MAPPTRRILVFREDKEDILVNYDIASTNVEKDKIANTIYEVLAMYSLDCQILEVKRGIYRVEGLNLVGHNKDVTSDIFEIYTEWYSDREL